MDLDRSVLSVTALYVVSHLYGILAGMLLQGTQVAQGSAIINQSPSSGLYMVLMIIGVTGLMLLLYFFNLDVLIKIWFLSAIFLTMLIFFSTFLSPFLAIGSATAAFVVRRFTPDLWTRNFIDTFSYAGAGALFGTMIGVIPALIFMGALALYDFLSVFMTGHMVSLAKKSLKTDTFMGMMYPRDGKSRHVNARDVKIKDEQGDMSESRIGILGGGDIIAPMIFSISLLSRYSVGATILSSLGSVVALVFLLTKSREDGGSYPGIPVLAGGSIAGLIVYLVLAPLF